MDTEIKIAESVLRSAAPARLSLDRRARTLIVAEAVLAFGAFGGAIGLIGGGIQLGNSEKDLPLESPTLAGVALAIICGVLPTLAAVATWRNAPWARLGHILVGLGLIGWIVVQVGFIGLGSWLQVAYFAYGVAILALALSDPSLRTRQPRSGRPT